MRSEFSGRFFMAEIMIHGEDHKACTANMVRELFGLRAAGDFVGLAMKDEDGETGRGAPFAGEIEFGPVGDIGRVGIEANAASAIGHGGFDLGWRFVLEEQGIEAPGVNRHLRFDWLAGIFQCATAHLQDVLAKIRPHAPGENDTLHFAGSLEHEGDEGGSGAVAEKKDLCWPKLSDGGGVGTNIKSERRFRAIAGRAFAIAKACLFHANRFVS